MNYSPPASLLEVTMFSWPIMQKTILKSNFVLYLLEKKDGLQEKKVSSDVTIHFLYG